MDSQEDQVTKMDASSSKMSEEQVIFGIGLSSGIAFGRAEVISYQDLCLEEKTLPSEEVESEVSRYKKALNRTQTELEAIHDSAPRVQNEQVSHIMQAHIEMLKDPLLTTEVENAIRTTQKNAEAVMHGLITAWQEHTSFQKDPFFKERSKDIQDLSHRVLSNLGVDASFSLDQLDEMSIVVAPEIASIHALEAHPDKVSGFVTRIGASTSHAAIIAKARGTPYVTGVDLSDIQGIERIIIDGDTGKVILNPSMGTIEAYKKVQKEQIQRAARLAKKAPLVFQMKEGPRVELMANIALAEEAQHAKEAGANGIGLVRSEYLIMGEGRLLGEEEQFLLYRRVAESTKELPAIVRTLDISQEDLAELAGETMPASPALYRGMRWLLKNRSFFKGHLRAIVRASAFGHLKVMFPMVTDVSELKEALQLLDEVTKELELKPLSVGCMIENPAAALMCEVFARYVDFFAIGTNDLTQYSTATDRRFSFNREIFCPMHPAVVRLIARITDVAKDYKIGVLACGDVASDPLYAPIFLGLGIRILSMPARCISPMGDYIKKLTLEKAEEAARCALEIESGAEMAQFLDRFQQEL
jgi:phosphoenolpyruvate-protein phosphotransferase (PTS system enzyme I)